MSSLSFFGELWSIGSSQDSRFQQNRRIFGSLLKIAEISGLLLKTPCSRSFCEKSRRLGAFVRRSDMLRLSTVLEITETHGF